MQVKMGPCTKMSTFFILFIFGASFACFLAARDTFLDAAFMRHANIFCIGEEPPNIYLRAKRSLLNVVGLDMPCIQLTELDLSDCSMLQGMWYSHNSADAFGKMVRSSKQF